MERITKDTPRICGDCMCEEGELHGWGCEHEICPNCKGQLISCGCFMDYRVYDKLEEIPNREPFFKTKTCCVRCGINFLYDPMLMVDDETWNKICGITFNKEDFLCKECMEFIMKKRKLNPKEKWCVSKQKGVKNEL